MTQALGSADGVTVTGAPEDRYDEVLTDRGAGVPRDAAPHLRRSPARAAGRPPGAVRRARRRRHARLPARDQGRPRGPSWRVAEPAPGLVDRRVEITGPTDREDDHQRAQLRRQGVAGRPRGRQHPALGEHGRAASSTCATRSTGTLDFTSPEGKDYALARRRARRPSWSARAAGTCRRSTSWSTASATSGSLVDFGLYFFHCAQPQLDARRRARTSTCRRWRATSRRGCGTTCSSLAQERARHPARHDPGDRADRDLPGRVRDGGDPLRAARALRRAERRPLGLHVQRHQEVPHPGRGLPAAGPQLGDDDRAVHARLHRAAGAHLPQARRARDRRHGGVHPEPTDPEVNEAALAKVRDDKTREAGDGFDGSWVAHPDLVPVCREVFDARARRPAEPARPAPATRCTVTADAAARRRRRPRARSPRPGCATTSASASSTSSRGCAAPARSRINNLMEDAATAEISRSQVWQWLHNDVTPATTGRPVTRELVERIDRRGDGQDPRRRRGAGAGRCDDARGAVHRGGAGRRLRRLPHPPGVRADALTWTAPSRRDHERGRTVDASSPPRLRAGARRRRR